MKAKRIEWRAPRRKVVRTEQSKAGSFARLECGHEIDTPGVQSGQYVRCEQCPQEEFYG